MKNIRFDYSRFTVWQYQRPSGHPKSGAFLRGTSAPITEWAFALVDDSAAPELVYETAFGTKNGFGSAEDAIVAARAADWARASVKQRQTAMDAAARQYERAAIAATGESNGERVDE